MTGLLYLRSKYVSALESMLSGAEQTDAELVGALATGEWKEASTSCERKDGLLGGCDALLVQLVTVGDAAAAMLQSGEAALLSAAEVEALRHLCTDLEQKRDEAVRRLAGLRHDGGDPDPGASGATALIG